MLLLLVLVVHLLKNTSIFVNTLNIDGEVLSNSSIIFDGGIFSVSLDLPLPEYYLNGNVWCVALNLTFLSIVNLRLFCVFDDQ